MGLRGGRSINRARRAVYLSGPTTRTAVPESTALATTLTATALCTPKAETHHAYVANTPLGLRCTAIEELIGAETRCQTVHSHRDVGCLTPEQLVAASILIGDEELRK